MKNLRIFFSTIAAFIFLIGHTPAHAVEQAIYAGMDTVQPVWAKNGMVASQQALATDVGVQILEQGGNAVDAAVAVGFALAVTLPRAGNIGGGGFMVVHLAKENKNITIDYREMAPSLAHPELFLNEEGNVDRRKALFHGASSGVPGSVRGLELALKTYGTMSLKQVMRPAIELAEKGFLVPFGLSKSLTALKRRLQQWPSTTRAYYKLDGSPYQPGERLILPDLANTLKLIAANGSDGFYKGEVAQKIVNGLRAVGGIMTMDDLANYKAVVREPIKGRYRGYDILSMPPPSSGGVHLVEILNVLENYDVSESGHNSAATIHQMAETMKFAYADRSEYLGDPDFYNVPVKALTDKAYAKRLFNRIDPTKATPSDEIKPAKIPPYESNETTHYSVVDRWGNAVSTTTTLNLSYGSSLVIEGTGILMNNEMDDFSSKPGEPNAYGLLGGEANKIEGGKRPLSAMTPTIVLKDGNVFLVTGSPGGARIITTTLQVVMNVIDHEMNVAEASYASRIHHQWYPDELRVERGLNKDTIALLKKMGHKVKMKSAMGSTQSIMKTPQGLFGASDPRVSGAKTSGF